MQIILTITAGELVTDPCVLTGPENCNLFWVADFSYRPLLEGGCSPPSTSSACGCLRCQLGHQNGAARPRY